MSKQLGVLFFSIFIFCLSFSSGCSRSGGHWQHYRLSALDEAKNRGMSIYLHFHEAGNKICESQKEALESLIQNAKFKNVGAYRIVYDSEKGLQKFFKVTQPCTLISLKGADEKGRAVEETTPALLAQILNQAL